LATLMDDQGLTEPNGLIGVEEKRPNRWQEWIRRPN
jgi:hypothetical protein